jgi:hypothetical protein
MLLLLKHVLLLVQWEEERPGRQSENPWDVVVVVVVVVFRPDPKKAVATKPKPTLHAPPSVFDPLGTRRKAGPGVSASVEEH